MVVCLSRGANFDEKFGQYGENGWNFPTKLMKKCSRSIQSGARQRSPCQKSPVELEHLEFDHREECVEGQEALEGRKTLS